MILRTANVIMLKTNSLVMPKTEGEQVVSSDAVSKNLINRAEKEIESTGFYAEAPEKRFSLTHEKKFLVGLYQICVIQNQESFIMAALINLLKFFESQAKTYECFNLAFGNKKSGDYISLVAQLRALIPDVIGEIEKILLPPVSTLISVGMFIGSKLNKFYVNSKIENELKKFKASEKNLIL
ncbi:MAG: hypothetical protein RsTaC01_0090 [Candidatus Paraimprobicoccus trichonymphae]|uniref:Uncharacterized protein n=1 Tax=Candidatus Paraimprobicoccus trichonymphae TaxID=3033793 RepID=A0AA48I255_9FIRM|nr:MAG: hypothetical protein RsTaC01_0090 [Candidatus Paraimprobicoccus trichonymphae]